jgi:hypothetical protein
MDSGVLAVSVEPASGAGLHEAQLPKFMDDFEWSVAWLQDTDTDEFYCVMSPGMSADISMFASSDGAGYEEFANSYDSWAGFFETGSISFYHELSAKVSAQATAYEPAAIEAAFGDILKRLVLVSVQQA